MQKIIVLVIMAVSLNGCMSTVTHFWNNGFPMSKKESEAYDRCFAEVKKDIGEGPNAETGSPEKQAYLIKFSQFVAQCMRKNTTYY